MAGIPEGSELQFLSRRGSWWGGRVSSLSVLAFGLTPYPPPGGRGTCLLCEAASKFFQMARGGAPTLHIGAPSLDESVSNSARRTFPRLCPRWEGGHLPRSQIPSPGFVCRGCGDCL